MRGFAGWSVLAFVLLVTADSARAQPVEEAQPVETTPSASSPRAADCSAGAGPECSEPAPPGTRREPYLPWRLQMDEDERAPDLGAPYERWYGWQTLAVDGVTLAAFGLAGLFDQTGLAFACLGGLLIGAPIVHLANDNFGSAAISFGMRLGSSLVAVSGLFIALDDAFDDSAASDDGKIALGLIVTLLGITGLVASVVIDPTLLAFKTESPSRERALQVVPWLDPERGRVGVRLALPL